MSDHVCKRNIIILKTKPRSAVISYYKSRTSTPVTMSALAMHCLRTVRLASTYWPNSPREGMFQVSKVPGNESSRTSSLQRAKVPLSESFRERLGLGPGNFTPLSKLAQEQKGSVPCQ